MTLDSSSPPQPSTLPRVIVNVATDAEEQEYKAGIELQVKLYMKEYLNTAEQIKIEKRKEKLNNISKYAYFTFSPSLFPSLSLCLFFSFSFSLSFFLSISLSLYLSSLFLLSLSFLSLSISLCLSLSLIYISLSLSLYLSLSHTNFLFLSLSLSLCAS
jgi:hypothetical protein